MSVAFKPVATGARTGTLTLAHNGPSGKTEVALSGPAVDTSPVAAVSPAAMPAPSVHVVLVTVKSEPAPVPMALNASDAVAFAALVTVSVCAVLVVPTFWLPNVSDVADTETDGAAVTAM